MLPTDLSAPTLAITPWPDPVIDRLGHDPRSLYVETFWLGILGPSTTWLLRRIAVGLERHPDGFDLPLEETARALGLGMKGGRASAFVRALGRCVQFGAATASGPMGLAVRRRLPPLTRHQVDRLPPELREAHASWQREQIGGGGTAAQRKRARALALSLFELDEPIEDVERHLHRWHFHPAVAHDAVHWARDRHLAARAAADAADATDADVGGGARRGAGDGRVAACGAGASSVVVLPVVPGAGSTVAAGTGSTVAAGDAPHETVAVPTRPRTITRPALDLAGEPSDAGLDGIVGPSDLGTSSSRPDDAA
ncbi:MAG: hypothetical protein HYX34_15845 [Actinobacteria bacterium]|nr:hypothetical protein [Actinomycetota bacterium]